VNDISDKYISIVAHDAGAATQIFAWIKSGLLRIERCKFCLEGPAAKSFRVQQPDTELLPLEDALIGTQILLSGTGWANSLEHDARMIAKNKGIKSIAVIDHWVNYRERFVRNHIEVMPDIIWVSDKYAYLKAKSCFPNIEIVEQRNDYIKDQVDEVSSFKIEKKGGTTNILYVLEPIREVWAGNDVLGEFQALEFFLNSIPSLSLGDCLSIVLKPHPSDPEDKYNQWVKSLSLSNIKIEKEKSLASLIAWSDVVVGCETYAMVVALYAKKRVISALPRYAHNCRLPFSKIERLNQMN
jgi:hypothetical protein